jgi:hypothetical protein
MVWLLGVRIAAVDATFAVVDIACLGLISRPNERDPGGQGKCQGRENDELFHMNSPLIRGIQVTGAAPADDGQSWVYRDGPRLDPL